VQAAKLIVYHIIATRLPTYVDFCRSIQSLGPMILVVYHNLLCLERIWNIETPLHPNSYSEILGRAVVFMIFIHTGIPEVSIISIIIVNPRNRRRPRGRQRAKTACHFFFGGGSQRVDSI
jgi:hypothetical protein